MNARNTLGNRWVPLGGMVLMAIAVVFPWVEAGTTIDATAFAGFEIPYVGAATVIVCAIGAGFALLAALRTSSWWWIVTNGVAGLILSITALWLIVLDVADSGAVRWFRRLLPEQLRESSPHVSIEVGLWVYLIVGAAVCLLSTWHALVATNAKWAPPVAAPIPEDSVWVEQATYAEVEIFDSNPWNL